VNGWDPVHGQPWRDPAFRIELGERACQELMTQADWQKILEIWSHQERLAHEFHSRRPPR
jgi:hypothetical protein